jgi:ribulose-5-phosphate 4-epimerase/fuculose-1-phosphate aldolase
MIGIEHPALNITLIEVEPDGVHYRMRFGTPDQATLNLNQDGVAPPAPTSEMFHYLLIFEQLEKQGFNALVHLQPKFLNLISRTEHGAPDRFYNFLRGYEPETPIIYDASSGIGFVEERAPGIPELSYESLRLFQNGGSPERYILYWVGHGTFSRGSDLLDAYKHAEYFEAAARMAWEANQQTVKAQAYTEEIVSCILREFNANREVNQHSDTDFQNSDTQGQSENVYNYP